MNTPTILPNGATTLSIYDNGDVGVVLADNGRDYVTWEFYRGDLKTTSHGHYYHKTHYADAIDRAKQDFKRRAFGQVD